MYINKITIHNFRNFEQYEIDFDKNLTVIVANNSAGKTTLLDTISIAFGSYIGIFPLGKNKGFKYTDATIVKNGDEPLYPIAIEADITINNKSASIKRELTKKGSTTTVKDTKALQNYAKINHTKLIEKEEVELPIVAYYGTGRLWRKIKKTTTLKESYARSFGYHGCLDPNSNFKAFEEWFLDQSRTEYDDIVKKVQTGKNITQNDLTTKNTTILKNVRNSIDIALKNIGFSNFRFNGKELVLDNKDGVALSITSLSDGVKSMFALVADIAYRCTKLNPSSEYASKTTQGVVLIDEIDMHLHPSWQQRVLKDLQNIFPKIQFIVTTHSPQVLSSVSNKHIRIIKPLDNKANKSIINPYGKQSIVALEDIMDVDATPPKDVIKETAILEEYLSLIQAGDINNDKLHSMRKTLNEVYGPSYNKLLIADMLINKHKSLQK
jgi:predicted ATP-binding protein involved in virulence